MKILGKGIAGIGLGFLALDNLNVKPAEFWFWSSKKKSNEKTKTYIWGNGSYTALPLHPNIYLLAVDLILYYILKILRIF